MDGAYEAFLAACAVGLVIHAGQRCREAIGGAVAGCPILTAPSLLWIAHSEGSACAASAAVASVAACTILAAFAAAYGRAARRAGPCGALVAAVGAAVAAAPLVQAASGHAQTAVLLAVVAIAAGRAAVSATAAHAHRTDPSPTAGDASRRSAYELPMTSAAAGVVSAITASVARLLGSSGSGVVASPPRVGGSAVFVAHRSGGAPAATRFLRGYLDGLYGKTAFGLTFAARIPLVGDGWALSLSTVAGCGASMLALRLQRPSGAASELVRATMR